jgi:hypothetical protein
VKNVTTNSVTEHIALVFDNVTRANDMGQALLDRCEGNTQIKCTKIMRLKIKFENFIVEDNESIEEMYTRLMSIQNKFMDLGELIINNKIIENIL